MIFSEIYGTYYNTVAAILHEAVDHRISIDRVREIADELAFFESSLNIETAIKEEKWMLIRKDGTTPIKHTPTLPLSDIQKRWLKSISLDPRIKLFGFNFEGLENVEPLFTEKDYCVFDKYGDGDDFNDPAYIERFQMILNAAKAKQPLKVTVISRRGTRSVQKIIPDHLEYSEKDDKFRLITSGSRHAAIVNLGRIVLCSPYEGTDLSGVTRPVKHLKKLVFELKDERNTLERALLHFSHFEKQAEKISEDGYRVTVTYDRDDEMELVIRVLSFGPLIRVLEPSSFVEIIRNRLQSQKSCGL